MQLRPRFLDPRFSESSIKHSSDPFVVVASSSAGQSTPVSSFCVDARWLDCVHTHVDPNATVFDATTHGVDAILTAAARAPIGTRVLASPTASMLDLADVRPQATDCATSLRRFLGGHWGRPVDIVLVRNVRRRSHLLAALPESGLAFALSDSGRSAFCDVSHADALKSLSKDTLRNSERLRRRAQQDFGTVAVESVTDPEMLHTSAFDRFVALEGSGWKADVGTSLAVDTTAQVFLRGVMHRFGTDRCARIDFLTVAGRDAAAQLMLRADRTWFLLKIGYDPAFKDVGPGGILLKAFLEEMVADPEIVEVNLTTNPPWARRWHFQTEPVHHVHIYNSTWRGRVLYAGRAVKELAKRLRNTSRTLRQPPPK